jgi:putative membrane protein
MIIRPYHLSAFAFLGAAFLCACEPDTNAGAAAPSYEMPAAFEVAAADLTARTGATEAFVTGAGQASLMQVEAGRIALQLARDPEVQSFAQLMTDQHRASREALAAAAEASSVPPPTPPLDAERAQRVEALSAPPSDADPQNRAGFDGRYIRFQADALKETIGIYESFVAAGGLPSVEMFADQTLPALREHLRRAEEIHAMLKTASAVQP